MRSSGGIGKRRNKFKYRRRLWRTCSWTLAAVISLDNFNCKYAREMGNLLWKKGAVMIHLKWENQVTRGRQFRPNCSNWCNCVMTELQSRGKVPISSLEYRQLYKSKSSKIDKNIWRIASPSPGHTRGKRAVPRAAAIYSQTRLLAALNDRPRTSS